MTSGTNKKSSTATIVEAIALMVVVNCIGISLISGKLDNIDKSLEASNAELNYLNSTIKEITYSKNEIEDISAKAAMKEINIEQYDIPDCDTSFKCYMDYRMITDKTSAQYEIQQSAWTDDYGFRRYDDDYIVAMGTYYSENCGQRFKITFDTENEITVLVGDIKADSHTNKTNQYTSVYDGNGKFISANVLEFIVDTEVLPKKMKRLGTVGTHSELEGNIINIERIYEG